MATKQLHELLLQSLEHERGGKRVYEVALECVISDELREELEKYLEETETHIEVLEEVFATLGLDADEQTVSRRIVRDLAAALVKAMKDAQMGADPATAELIAMECVVLAETKDHLDWHLLGACAKKLSGRAGDALKAAVERVENQEDEHLYHTRGWCRELWMKALGVKSVLPPPEERRHVTTAIGAARAEQQRSAMR